ncbi:MAG: DNA polymerase III subunit beta [Acidobacteria bacterium]|nr:DNA polymerase III subunit beta [Acidobacteriota bacterium]
MVHFKAKTPILAAELGLIQSVVEKRSTIPILSHLLLEASGEYLKITGTDLDLGLTTSCPAEVEAAGSVTVPAKRIFEIVRSLPDGEVSFQSDASNRIHVSCERSRFKLTGLDRENYPQLPQSPSSPGLSIPAGIFREFVQRTIFATTQEESRYALSGVQMEGHPALGTIRMIATDGHRLAYVETQLKDARIPDLKLLIPKKALAELLKIGSQPDEPVEITRDENHIHFKLGRCQLSSRVLAGQFPNYEMVLPKENPKIAHVAASLFCAALRRVSIVTDERSRAIRLQVAPDRFDLSAVRAEGGEEAREDFMVSYSGEEFEIGFNSGFLLDFFSAVPTGDLRMEFKDARGPILIRPIEEKYDYKYVVMPLRV